MSDVLQIFFIVMNIVFAKLAWDWADDYFEQDRMVMGWMFVILSAWNAATALSMVT